jgi:CBS domain containing-hemolysin-like protein
MYIFLALFVSFLCSILEAVLLSINDTYIALLELKKPRRGKRLRLLKKQINQPLAAILTLNTIAHTVGAAGAGAQAASVFGNAYIGAISAILTLLILVFSEIIPKTLGAHYWQRLAPVTGFTLEYLVIALYPFVKLSNWLTDKLTNKAKPEGFSREEFSALADISTQYGTLDPHESTVVKNLLLLPHTSVKDAMTPRTVIFSLPESMTVDVYFFKHSHLAFTRIPIYKQTADEPSHYVFRSDLLLAKARDNGQKTLNNYGFELPTIPSGTSLDLAFHEFTQKRTHMMLAIDEYGTTQGIITLEDVIETMLGLEIVDEKDHSVDMQQEARRLWKRRAKEKGLDV